MGIQIGRSRSGYHVEAAVGENEPEVACPAKSIDL
jgi:hypothetical protein